MKKIDENYFIKDNDVNYEQTIDASLYPGEKILWRAKPNKKCYYANSWFKYIFIGAIWLIFDGAFIVVTLVNIKNIPSFAIFGLVIFFVFHLLPVWLCISSVITARRRWKLEEYAFTDTRILIHRGIIGTNIISIGYDSITSVNIKIGFMERMYKVGDIYIVSNGQTNVFQDIEDPYFIYGRLQKIANDIKTDIIYPNAYRPKENPGYKTSYNPQTFDQRKSKFMDDSKDIE